MLSDIKNYNEKLSPEDEMICNILADLINLSLNESESKIWHAHPVWFLDQNPIVGYSKQKKGIRLMFWSGADFDEEKLNVRGKKFKDASVFFTNHTQINAEDMLRWLLLSKEIQWDYKNIVRNKGRLEKLEK